jgi:hypothetical protein
MSDWKVVTSTDDCDTEGCPCDLTITRRAKKGEKDGDPVPEKEMLEALRKLGWKAKSYAHGTFCPQCVKEGLA